MSALDASSGSTSGQDAIDRSALDLHLHVVGSLLEEHRLYEGSRMQAVKDMVLSVMGERLPATSTLRQIQEVLCFDDVPLVPEEVLRQALNLLVREDKKVEVVAKQPKVYKLTVTLPERKNSLNEMVMDAWRRHFVTLESGKVEEFRHCLALLFARYGCSAYETLISRGAAHVSIDDVIAKAVPADRRAEFTECFAEFVQSPHPTDATLKVGLASTYALLRMNGTGNWGGNELRGFFDGKTFLLDTNILFELMSRNVGQVAKMFAFLGDFNAKFCVASETQKEFERALRSRAEQVVQLVSRGVNLRGLADAQVLRADWIAALLSDHASPSREQVETRVGALLSQVEGMLSAGGVVSVHADRGAATATREERIDRIKEVAMEVRSFAKSDDVALHDALLWEAVDEDPRLADLILTMDRSLGRIRPNGQRIAIMLDEVVAYALMGGAREPELASLFSHTLAQDLHPDAPFLTLEDVTTIAGMEVNLLSGPPRTLKRAAAHLAQLRSRRATSGEPVRDDEVGRIFVGALSSYRDDRLLAEKARAAAEKARSEADAERAEKVAARKNAEELREKLSVEEKVGAARVSSAEGRVQGVESELARVRSELASLKADEAARERRKKVEEDEAQTARNAAKRRKDWMLWSAFAIGVAVALGVFGIFWGAAVACIAGIVALVWGAQAQETPSVSLTALSFIVAVIVATAGIAEKWSQARAALKLPAPTSSASTALEDHRPPTPKAAATGTVSTPATGSNQLPSP